jgi:hypothetical protein
MTGYFNFAKGFSAQLMLFTSCEVKELSFFILLTGNGKQTLPCTAEG